MSLSVGYIGLGNMGGRMSQRLIAADIPMVGYDPNPAQNEFWGVPRADSIQELVAASDVIFFSLPNSGVVEAVVYGEGGVLANCREGQIIIDMTTASPASSRKIAADLATKGVFFLDSGVSGGAPSAGNGTLIVMVGGDADALAKVGDVLAPLVKIVHHMGASGSGHTAKLINNFLNGVSLSATAEAMVVAKQAGLDLKQMLDVLNASSGMNFATVNRFPRIIEGDYLEGGLSGALMEKDMHLYVELARDMGVPALNAHGSLATFQVANGLGYVDKISNRVVDAIGEYSGGVSITD